MTIARPERSILATPGSNTRMIEKALASDADVVMIDLEDAVAPGAKSESRVIVAAALCDGDWRGRPRTFRMNALDTPWFVRDLVDITEQTGAALDRIVLPKARSSADVVTVATMLNALEAGVDHVEPIGLDVQIESASGLVHCEAIATASTRIQALVFGPGDYAATVGMPLTAIGTPDEWDTSYPGHRWDYPMHRLVVAARAAGVRTIDGPYADFRDEAGFRRSCLTARALGFDGKWCIHPAQVPIANEVFTPTSEEVAWAREVLSANEAAAVAGRGSFALDGRMIDAASLRMARATLARAAQDEFTTDAG